MAAYYNEFDPKTAAWLRELISRGLIAPGDVDERSIKDVQPDDLKGYTQVHLFAGIGGWSVGARLAGIPDDFAFWSGSCPCQPFSFAGRRNGVDDERHLWPEMFRLIRQCRPSIVFGEQVEGAIKHGWLDLVFDELEAEGYACAANVLPACSVGARHIRQRIWWVADFDSAGRQVRERLPANEEQHGQRAAVADGRDAGWREQWALEPIVGRVVHGVQPGNSLVRGFGNAIVPQVAAEFIQAYLETKEV